MDLSADYERHLDQEMTRCDSLYAFYQELEWLVHSEMTDLERRIERLAADKERLSEARELYLVQHPL